MTRAPRGDLGGDEHAVGDRLSVPEPLVFRHRLEGVARGVAEIQNPAEPGLLLVRGDDARLDPARFGDDRGERGRLAIEDRLEVAADALEQPGLDVTPYFTTS